MSSDDGYVHTPERADSATATDESAATATDESATTADGEPATTADDEPSAAAERRGTVLVVAIAFATLVIPGAIYLYPALLADRVPFLVAMLALPFVPAVLLGLIAVWSMKE